MKRLRTHAMYQGYYPWYASVWCETLLMQGMLHHQLRNILKTGYWKLILSSLILNIDNECKTFQLEDFINDFRHPSDCFLDFQVLHFEISDFELFNAVSKVSTTKSSPTERNMEDKWKFCWCKLNLEFEQTTHRNEKRSLKSYDNLQRGKVKFWIVQLTPKLFLDNV